MDTDDFLLTPEEDRGMWICALLFTALGADLGYSLIAGFL